MSHDLKVIKGTMSPPPTPFLEVSQISKSYGGVQALIDCNFSCRRGEVHALLGENGAGKSTLVKILCGVVKPDSGTIRLDGREARISSPIDASRHGIVAVFQELSLVPDLSVAENIYLGHEPRTKWGLIDFRLLKARTERLFAQWAIPVDPDALIRDLTLSDRQLVEIGKALSRDPEVLIFDEATSALGHKEVELLFSWIKRLTQQGKTSIFISHRMDELERIADRATVFRDARYVATFDWGTESTEQIVNWIAGRDLHETYPKKANLPAPDELALVVRHLTSQPHFFDVNLELKRGEIVGIAGLQGHGQTQFLQALFGACPITDGEIVVRNRQASLRGPRSAIRSSIVLVPEDRKQQGLLLTRSVKENAALMTLDRRQRLGWIQANEERKDVEDVSRRLNIKVPTADLDVWELSGGNQQKVVIAKAILCGSDIILLADPTRGIDIGTKSEIYQLLIELAQQGKSILFYSTEIPELVGISDRVAVFKQGRVTAMLEGTDITEHKIINAAMGIAEGGVQ